jgi:hypothetical protein
LCCSISDRPSNALDGGDREMVAATGAVVHADVGAGEGMCEERADRVDRHAQ